MKILLLWLEFVGFPVTITCAIGLWKYFRKKELKRDELIDEAERLMTEGIRESNLSKLNAGFDRINRLRK